MQPDLDEWRARLRRRLAVVTDYGLPYGVRLAAVKAVQNQMQPDSELRAESAESLLDRVLRPFDRREYAIARRAVMLPVRRPPRSVCDVWE